MEEELPQVAQFIQVHVTQADQPKSQEGFGIPPACVVHKQVTLVQTGCRSKKKCNNIAEIFTFILEKAFYGMEATD